MAVKARIGCSGWQYKHWRDNFYPLGLPQSRWFDYYATQFDTVEINNTFYRLPQKTTFASWEQCAPDDFIYAVKASRFLTHMKKLNEPAEPLARLFARAEPLGRTFGPVLYQLPPNWAIDIPRFADFVQQLPRRHQHAIEFRDPSWYSDDIFALLAQYGVALCLHDMAGSATGRMAIGPFVYIRFHGPQKYQGRYGDRVIEEWGAWIAEQMHGGRPAFAYFNNDIGGHAPRDAIRLRGVIEGIDIRKR